MIKTLQTNWRDIIAGLGITLAAALLADVITNLSIRADGLVWLANVAAVLTGAARFFAANMIGFLAVAVAWPSVNRWSNERFAAGWAALPERDRLLVMIGVSCLYVLAAAIAIG